MAAAGIITNIQRFSLHDGPGIRTTVFFKGCPLRCLWCHNPETWRTGQELCYRAEKCIGCGQCLWQCGRQALGKGKEGLEYEKQRCSGCFSCAENCPSQALFVCGKEKTIEETMEELMADCALYEKSGGGVTFSGGEATMQSGFVTELANALKVKGISLALDTCGYCEPEQFRRVAEPMDLVLFDIKHSDSRRHKELTGAENGLILENLFFLEKAGKRIHIRIPVIPGYNDDEENMERTAELLASLNQVEEVALLGYHKLGLSKVIPFGDRQRDLGVPVPSREAMEKRKQYFQERLSEKRVILR